MNIGEVIRKYRKENHMTQEEVANRLGVTAPAVNKWESGTTMPDIMLLSPIARLLKISLDELLSFRKDLTMREIRDMVQTAEKMISADGFDHAFSWVKEQVQEYPNCDTLVYMLTALLDHAREVQDISISEEQNSFLLRNYELGLTSSDKGISSASANALFRYYIQHFQAEKAEECMKFMNESEEQTLSQARLYEKTGNTNLAWQAYERFLEREYSSLSSMLHHLMQLKLEEGDVESASYYAEKEKLLSQVFDQGEFQTRCVDRDLIVARRDPDETITYISDLLNHIDSISARAKSPLFAHLYQTDKQKNSMRAYSALVISDFFDELAEDSRLSYMAGDPRWEAIMSAWCQSDSDEDL